MLSITSRGRRLRQLPDLDTGLVVNGRVARHPERLVFTVLQRRYEVSSGVSGRCTWVPAVPCPGRARWARCAAGDRVADLFAGAGLFGGSLVMSWAQPGACSGGARSVGVRRRGEDTADQPHVEVLKAAVTPALVSERLASMDLIVLDPSRTARGGS